MPKEYLRPEDVRAEHAREVLDFLNAAETAEQIAAAVDIPLEPDVDVQIAQRILERRRQLGGFTDLQQLAAVPLVGPERFTEIVTTLSGARMPPAALRGAQMTAPSTELLREIRALRDQVKALQTAIGGQPRISLRALQERPFLGQAVNLMVTVTEAERPRIGTPLTLSTTWGRLRAVDGSTTREGNSVTTRTDGNGLARALLLPPTSEDLLPVQQDTLEAALRMLDTGAATPRATENGLREIARQYRWDGNPQLRRAIDIYFRDFGGGLLETVNVRDYLLAWSYLDSTVLAYVRDDTESGSTAVRATAALSLRFKNWLGPWLETMQTVARSESRLAEDFLEAKETEETGALLGHVYGRVRDFVSEQRGLVGGYVGQRIAETSLRDFLQTGIEDLPQERQLEIFPALDAASHTVASSGANVLATVDQTRAELRSQLGGKVDESEFSGLQTEVNNKLAAKVDESKFNNLQTEVSNKLAAKVDSATFDSRLNQLDAKIVEIETKRIDVLAGNVENLQSQLDGKVDVAVFDDALETKLDATELDGFKTEVSSQLTKKVDSTTFSTALAGKVNNATFNEALAAKVDESKLNNLRTEVNNKLAAKVDGTIFDSRLNQLQTKVSDLEGRVEPQRR